MEPTVFLGFLICTFLSAQCAASNHREFNGTLNVAIVHPLYSNTTARALASTIFAIEHINNKSDGIFDNLLPNTTVVYEHYDSLGSHEEIARVAADLRHEAFRGQGADVVIAASTSWRTITLQSIIKHFSLPQVSPYASAGKLSNVEEFPFFLRTVPTDEYLINAMVSFATKTIGWNYAAIISGDDEYSQTGASGLLAAAKQHNLQVVYHKSFETGKSGMDLQDVAHSGTNLFIYFGRPSSIVPFLRALYKALLQTDMLASGFSILFGDVYLGEDVKTKFEEAGESHIYEAMCNGTFALSLQMLGNFTKTYRMLFKERVKSLGQCNSVSCGCDKRMVDYRTNKSVFFYNSLAGQATECISIDPVLPISYYDPLAYDAAVFVASVVHEMKNKLHMNSFNAIDFMNVSTSRGFKVEEGATGSIKLQPNGDRAYTSDVACNVWNMRIGPTTNNDDDEAHLAYTGSLSGTGPTLKFTFCEPSSVIENLGSDSSLCSPLFFFNTKNNKPRMAKHTSLSKLRIGLVTPTFRNATSFTTDQTGAQRTMVMLMAIDEISNRADGLYDDLLPSTSIEYEWMNSERDESIAAVAARTLSLAGFGGKGADIIVGGFSSGPTIAMQLILKHSKTLQISPSATSTKLSDDNYYPHFLRTNPSDKFIFSRMLGFAKMFMNWDEVTLISDKSVYSENGAEFVKSEASIQNLDIFVHMELETSLSNLRSETLRALRANSRGYIVVLLFNIETVLEEIMLVAEQMGIDLGEFCFLIPEAVLTMKEFPAIADGSFVFVPYVTNGHTQSSTTDSPKERLLNRANNIVKNVTTCVEQNSNYSRCDCIPDPWKPIFSTEIDGNTHCTFPNKIINEEYFTPFSYDAILAIANIQHDLIEHQGATKITPTSMRNRALDPSFNFRGMTGSLSFQSTGDRLIRDSIKVDVFNVRINNTDTPLSKIGRIDQKYSFHYCDSSADSDCKTNIYYGTKLNAKPGSFKGACKTNTDCNEGGKCWENDWSCTCSPEFIGMRCQHRLFKRQKHYTNFDGSERCLKYIVPTDPPTETPIRLCLFTPGWDTHSLVSDLARLLMVEIMQMRVEIIEHTYTADYIEALSRNHCHVVLEDWFRKHHASQELYIGPNKPVLDLGFIGYYGRDGWFMNRASLDEDSTRLSYTSFRKHNTIKAMQNLTIPHYLVQNCSNIKEQAEEYCDRGRGIFTNNDTCSQRERGCGVLYGASVDYACCGIIQRQIMGLGLDLEIRWLGNENIPIFVKDHVLSKLPFVFYWWSPDSFLASFNNNELYRVELPPYNKAVFETTGACDFPSTRMRKLVNSKIPSRAIEFFSNFKINAVEINELLFAMGNDDSDGRSAVCKLMDNPERKAKLLSFVPVHSARQNIVTVGVAVSRDSSLLMGKLIEILIKEHLLMGVTIERADNDAHLLALIKDGVVDVAAEVFFESQKDLSLTGVHAFSNTYTGRGGLYTYFPGPRYDTKARETGKIWYLNNELVNYMAPLGTYSPSPGQCSLWWCNYPLTTPGTFSPTYCIDKSKSCCEILIGTGLNGFHRWSILAEIIQTLRLPFVMVFVTPSVIQTALATSAYATVFFSGERLEETSGLFRYILPSFTPACFLQSIETKYNFRNPTLGTYSCDFPEQTAYILGSTSLDYKPIALRMLLERAKLTDVDLATMKTRLIRNFSDIDITNVIHDWLNENNKTWVKWIEGCDNMPGYYGIQGKCNACPKGTYSSAGSNKCKMCPLGTYTGFTGTSYCSLCPTRTYTIHTGSTSASDCLCVPGLIGDAVVGCTSCPSNAICRRGRAFAPNGYWRFTNDSIEIFRCPFPSACIGIAYKSKTDSSLGMYDESEDNKEGCAPFNEGNLCHRCEKGYFRALMGGCEECYPKSSLVLIQVLSALLMISLVFVSIKYSQSSAPKLRQVHSKLEELRYSIDAHDVCVFTCETDPKICRFLDHVTAPQAKREEIAVLRQRGQASVASESMFNVSKALNLAYTTTLAADNSKISSQLPEKLNLNDYPNIKQCVQHISHRTVRDVEAASLSLFDTAEEIHIYPITTDMNFIGGVMLVSYKSGGRMDSRQEKIFDFIVRSGENLVSQCEDHRAIIFKILLSHFQIYAASRYVLFPWTAEMSNTFEVTEALFGMMSSIFANECSLGDFCGELNPLYCKTIMVLIMPPLIFAGFYLSGILVILLRYRRTSLESAKQTVNSFAGIATIIILYYVHGAIANQAFSMLPCRELGSNGPWLFADYDIRCDTSSRIVWSMCLLIPAFLLYVVGIPLAMAYVVHVNRNALGFFKTRRFIGILYNGYRLKYYWWEAVVLLRKASIIGAIRLFSVFSVSAQTSALLLLLTSSLLLEYSVQPYAWLLIARTERMTLIVEVASFFLASLYGNRVIQGNGGRAFVEWSILFLNLALVVTTISRVSNVGKRFGIGYVGKLFSKHFEEGEKRKGAAGRLRGLQRKSSRTMMDDLSRKRLEKVGETPPSMEMQTISVKSSTVRNAAGDGSQGDWVNTINPMHDRGRGKKNESDDAVVVNVQKPRSVSEATKQRMKRITSIAALKKKRSQSIEKKVTI